MPRPQSLSAALRHARDAVHLAAPGPHRSSDQAWHLAGIAVECARKGVLSDTRFDLPLGHDFPEHLLSLALALEPRARAVPGLPAALTGWQIGSRYLPTGAISAANAHAAAHAADTLVADTVAHLWADGRLKVVPP